MPTAKATITAIAARNSRGVVKSCRARKKPAAMPIHSQSMLIAGRGLPFRTAQTRRSCARRPAPARPHRWPEADGKLRPADRRDKPEHRQQQPKHDQRQPVAVLRADSLGNSGRATISAIMPPSSHGRIRSASDKAATAGRADPPATAGRADPPATVGRADPLATVGRADKAATAGRAGSEPARTATIATFACSFAATW